MLCRMVQRTMTICAALVAASPVQMLAAETSLETEMPSYHVTRYTAEQGLPQNTVRALLQTSDGYIWVGTLAGLARFDGVKFTVFNSSNTPEMPNDAINALAEDRQDSSLWVNAGKGLLRYHNHRFERFDEEMGVPQPFGRLWPARKGGVWYSPSSGSLILFQNQKVHAWRLPVRPVLAYRILQIEEQDDGSVLVLTHVRIYRFEPETGRISPLGPRGYTDTSLRYFFRRPDGTMLLAGREGLWLSNANGWERIETVTPSDPEYPVLICPSRDGDLWIPWGGVGPPRLAKFRSGRSKFVDLSKLPDYPMNVFLEDLEGHLWIGTESGLCQLRPKAVRVYSCEQGLRNDFVKSLTAGPDGTIWVGTEAGVSGIKDDVITNLPPMETSGWGRAEGLLADRRGRVWHCDQTHTVVAFDSGMWVSPAPLNMGESWVRTLYEDRSGQVWGGFDQGVAWIDETGAVQKLTQTLSHPDVRVIYQDRHGDIWFGTYGGGLNRLHDGRITVDATGLGEYNNRAWWIHEDADGVFWVGTRNGLNRFVPPGHESAERSSPGQAGAQERPPAAEERQPAGTVTANTDGNRFFTFTTQHGLRENVINNIQEDDAGFLWLSGLQGIYCVARKELNEVASGRRSQVQVLAFGEADGMLNSQCNGGVIQPSGCKDRWGRIWFPTARGVAMIDPRTVRRNDVPPPVVIEQVIADDEIIYGDNANPQLSTSNFQLPPGRARVIEIHYTANSFAAPHRVRFKYQLEGVDQGWRDDDQNRRVAFYTRLRPGSYTFRVRACNNHGVWSETPVQFSFTLAPHFWETWFFYVLATAGVVGLASAVQAYRLRWQRRVLQLEQQHALADERARIARDLHDDLGTALTGLALQVDVLRRSAREPHALVSRLIEVATGIRALAERMREVVWAVNPQCDTVSSVASFLEEQASLFLKADGLRCRFEFPEDIPALPLDGETRHELALSVREALSNAVHHAAATEIVLSLRIETDQLVVRIADNGRGFHVAESIAKGHGLANVQARMEKIGGQCECRSTPGSGTTVQFRIPLGERPNRLEPLR
ncbi:MAG: hypothetical protein GX456_11520 [Verrucomicrobia bacterium]|nr:hypothetical protein [Verrucomicrobiota bacterium]